MERLFIRIFNMSISASWLILAVIAVRFLLRKAPKSMRCFLWLLVGIRLLLPFSIESVFSLIPNTQVMEEQSTYWQQQPVIFTDTAAAGQSIGQLPYEEAVTIAATGINKTWNIRTVCTRVWIAGVALMLGYIVVSWIRIRRRVKTAVPMDFAIDEEHQTRVYQSDMIDSPFLFGIVPRIYIPNDIAAENLPYVILHEKAHIKRGDYLIKPISFLILAVYWFNPLIWAAYAMLCKDIELVCDEMVIRKLGEQCKKAYSQALLTGAVNRRMITACPVAFGEVGVKARVKNVLNYKKPAFWILAAAILACIIVPVCFMTRKKEETMEAQATPEQLAGTYDMAVSQPDTYTFVPYLELGAEGSFALSYSMLSSYWPHSENYEIKGNVLMVTTDDGLYHYQFTITDSGSLIFDAANSSETAWDDKMSEAPLVDGAEFVKRASVAAKEEEPDIAQTEELLQKADALSEELDRQWLHSETATSQELYLYVKQAELEALKKQLQAELDEMEELIALMQAEVKTLEDEHQEEARQAREVRMQELSMELQISLEQLEKKQAMLEALLALEGQEPDARGYIEQWAQAFCNRDAVTIIRLANERVEEKLTNSDLLVHSFADGKDYAGFGWSSPWPWGNGDSYDEAAPAPNYRIVNVTDRSAEILYYAWVSNPHVTVWRELLTFSTENDEFVITSETLEYMDSICTAEQFYQAYPNGVISGTMMDYYEYNGAGEALNNNAKEGRESGDLFIADKAALYLLNASGSTRINLTEDKSICVVRITFGDKSSVDVTMIQPYGEDGIWIPWSDGEPQDMSSGGAGSYTINSQNIDSIRREDAARLEALFPDHHESRTVSGYVDLNGDGDMEKVELTDLRYNGGDGGYALTVTDGKTGKEIPLPAGYTQESGFPLQAIYVQPRRELAILMGEEYPKRMLVSISEGALLDIYERKGMYQEIKRSLNSSVGDLRVDALSGCSITCIGEENPVLVLKSYVSGFMGHADTLGYVITELRLQKDNTWEEKSYFLLDSCAEQITQNTAVEKEAVGGFRNLPFQSDTDIKIVQLQ